MVSDRFAYAKPIYSAVCLSMRQDVVILYDGILTE
jgi:hypothetical protein